MSYDSPITIYENLANQIAEYREGQIVAQVQMYIDVNKEELFKALAYDRHQYEKGYQDGRKDYEKTHSEWINEGGVLICNCCQYTQFDNVAFNFCPNCGADMRGDNNG